MKRRLTHTHTHTNQIPRNAGGACCHHSRCHAAASGRRAPLLHVAATRTPRPRAAPSSASDLSMLPMLHFLARHVHSAPCVMIIISGLVCCALRPDHSQIGHTMLGIEDGDAFPRVLIKNEHLHVMYQESRVQRRMLSPRSDASIASLVRTRAAKVGQLMANGAEGPHWPKARRRRPLEKIGL